MMEKNYIQLLIQSLEKKMAVLDHVISLNDQQKDLLSKEEVDLDELMKEYSGKGFKIIPSTISKSYSSTTYAICAKPFL